MILFRDFAAVSSDVGLELLPQPSTLSHQEFQP